MANEKQRKIFAKNFNRLLDAKDVTRAEISRQLGYPETTLANWANGVNYPRIDKIQELADFFNVKKSDLIEDKDARMEQINEIINNAPNLHPIRHIRKVPILGTIACGSPMWVEENFDGYLGIDPTVMDGDFALYCKGDSMIDAEIHDGDLALLKKTDYVENGRIAAVYFDGEATLKKVYSYPDKDQVILQPCNPEYSPIIYSKGDMEFEKPVILGELVGVYQYRDKN